VDEPLELISPRLRLRRLGADDAAAICAYRSLPEVARFQSWESFGSEDAARLIAAQEGAPPNTPGTWLQLALTTLESGEIVGDCGIHFLADDDRQVELGVTLAPAHQGRGLAAEAVGRVLRYVFEPLGKHRARAVTDAENLPAARLFRRLGFRQEAHFVEHVRFKGAWGSEFLFALLRREWQAGVFARP
jgi:RimJ/RimL family protein N-acetyltransferase